MRFLKVLILVVLVFIMLVFFIQNNAILSTPMELHVDWYLGEPFTSIPIPFYLVVLLGFLLGGVASWSLLLLDSLKLKQGLRRQRKVIRLLEKELAILQAVSLKSALAAEKRNMPMLPEVYTFESTASSITDDSTQDSSEFDKN